MAQAQPFTLRCQGVSRAMEESGSQGILLIEDSTEDYVVAQYMLRRVTDCPLLRCVDFECLRYILELLMRHWFSAVTLPERRSP